MLDSKGLVELVYRGIDNIKKNIEDIKDLQNNNSSGTNPFRGKKMAAIGDSITADNSYLNPLSQKLETSSQNLGIGGQSYTGGAFLNQVNNILIDTKFIVLAGGINDFRTNKELGTVKDLTENNSDTFYNALYSIFKKTSVDFPDAKIIIVTPYNNFDWQYPEYPSYNQKNTLGYYLWEYVEAMKQRAGMFGIPVANINAESGISEQSYLKYLSDGIHLNSAGGELVANLIKDKIFKTYYFIA